MSETIIDKPVYDTDSSYKEVCEDCNGTGVQTRDVWVEPNDSYEVEAKCNCQED